MTRFALYFNSGENHVGIYVHHSKVMSCPAPDTLILLQKPELSRLTTQKIIFLQIPFSPRFFLTFFNLPSHYIAPVRQPRAKQKVSIAILNLMDRQYSVLDIKKGIVGSLQPDRNRSLKEVWVITTNKRLFKVLRTSVFDDSIYEELNSL
jgi:hypothetical protein